MRKVLFILSLFAWAQASLSFATAAGRGDDMRDEVMVEKAGPIVSVADNIMYLTGVKEGTKVEVMNMLGVSVVTFETSSDNDVVSLNLRKGFYVVKIGNLVQRFVIK
ncbi:MAG: T9SS type A sorting domain-containing protein [Paludibacteraceae bacterium]|nr:T9SS type A sorting domain-containing protein [Paludibacteraceae bacterium]